MPNMANQGYLLHDQYKDASKLNARIQLHQRFSTNPGDWQHWVFDQLIVPEGARILELGCGPAQFWRSNLERMPSDWQVTLSDFSAGMLREAEATLRDSGRNFTFEVVDAQAIPFEDQTFDVVIANHMLYHVPDRQRAFAEIRRVLKPEGRFYAATNGDGHLREIDQIMARFAVPTFFDIARSERNFNLESGTEQLAPWFTHIEIRRWENGLAVTEVEPLVAFICSTSAASAFQGGEVEALREYLNQEMARDGVIRIAKSTGLFIASGQPSQD